MLTYFFTNIGSDSLYEHLYKCLKNDIERGELAPSMKLPSKRGFAKNLAISTITVENAYQQLMAEGYIYSIPKKGYYVAEVSARPSLKKERTEKSCDAPVQKKAFAVDFAENRTNPETFPFALWTRLMREVMNELPTKLMTNSPVEGIPELRREIALHLKKYRGMNVSAENIVIGAGTDYLYRLLIELLGHDRLYAAEDPGYRKLSRIYEGANASCAFIPLDTSGLDARALWDSGAEIVHISPSHHFPTGIVTPISRRYELLGWAAAEEGRYIIEDDFDSEFRLAGKPIPSLQSIDVLEKVIYMNTFTKSLASTIRISYMVLPDHLMERFLRCMSFYSNTVSNFEQYTLARFLHGGHFERHINRMRGYYRLLRDSLVEAIETGSLGGRVSIHEENAGLHFLLRVKTDTPDAELSARAAKQGVRLAFLSEFYQSQPEGCEHTLVINYSGIRPEDVQGAVALLEKCLEE